MCGIAGYVGPQNAVEVAFDQLKRLEYRGYDSAGISFLQDGHLEVIKKSGKLANLGALLKEKSPVSHTAMAHSRWATHGGPTDINAHPHLDQSGEVALIHNGIIENYLELADELKRRGHTFRSETDTEVAAHVIGEEYAATSDPLEEAVRRAVTKLRGAYALVVQSSREPGKLVAVRNASPLVLGVGKQENMLASDIPALLPYTRQIIVLEEGAIACLTQDQIEIRDRDGRILPNTSSYIEWDVAAAERGGYDHFLLKEIMEQPDVIRNSLAGRITPQDEVRLEHLFSDHIWTEVDRVNIIGCGTAFHAGLMGKHLFEKLLRLPTDVYYSSEFRYGDPVLSPKSIAIFVSQSGETADTLAALRLCKARRIRTLGIVNVVGSSIARECDRTMVTQAGPEISVASTKAYTAQVLALTLLALHIVRIQETPGIAIRDWTEALRRLPDVAREVLATEPQVRELATKIQATPLCFFLGRGADAYVGFEAALKLKEIAYIATQESPAGEMKHGPLALVVPGVVAVFSCTDSSIVDKIVSNMKEVQARGGTVVCVTSDVTGIVKRAADITIEIPATKHEFLNALLAVIPLQMLAYHVAKLRGCDIDQPRNLAKSVTVE
jgi:glucosamine--fructose-6-phosphate aminotransferase (isomerizing)